MNYRQRFAPIRKPPYWGNIKQEADTMADPLSLTIDACRALEYACKEANVAMPEIRFPTSRDRFNFEACLKATQTAKMVLTIDSQGMTDFGVMGIRITSGS